MSIVQIAESGCPACQCAAVTFSMFVSAYTIVDYKAAGKPVADAFSSMHPEKY